MKGLSNLKNYDVRVRRGFRFYRFVIVAVSIDHALDQLSSYVDLTNRTYSLKSIIEAS